MAPPSSTPYSGPWIPWAPEAHHRRSNLNPIADDLVERFDRGRLSRRELVQGLALLAAASQLPAAAAAAEPAMPIAARSIDHVSLLVRDLPSAAAFYQNVFGLHAVGEDKEHLILRLGAGPVPPPGGPRGRAIVSLRQEPPAGVVDHFAFRVEGFDKAAVTRQLRQHGLTTQENLEYGFHVKDPDGFNVQLV